MHGSSYAYEWIIHKLHVNRELTMFPFPKQESLTEIFKADSSDGLPDKVVIEAVVGLANAKGGTLYIGIQDNGTVTGICLEKWCNSQIVAATIAGNTVPPVCVEAEIVGGVLDRKVLVIHVPKADCIVATADGKVIRRRIKVDGTPENIPMFPQEYNHCCPKQNVHRGMSLI